MLRVLTTEMISITPITPVHCAPRMRCTSGWAIIEMPTPAGSTMTADTPIAARNMTPGLSGDSCWEAKPENNARFSGSTSSVVVRVPTSCPTA